MSGARARRRRLAPGPIVGAALLALFAVAAAFGPSVAPASPTEQHLDHLLEAPSRAHLLGTDENGCDVASQLLFGAREAALVGAAVVLVSALVGLVVGVPAGYLGGAVDELLMRVVDIFLAFPGLLLNLAIIALLAKPGPLALVLSLSVNGWVGYARVARGEVLRLRERAFVEAARAVGGSPLWVMCRHVAPQVLGPLSIQMTFGYSSVILVEASLSFLGVGRLTSYSWGALLSQGTTYLWRTQHLAVFPGLCIAAVVLACNLLGDALREV